MNHNILKTIICDDCMHGRHEVLGHSDCDCICHNNPTCFICGHVLLDSKVDSHEMDSHISCLNNYNDQKSDEYLDNMITKYGREEI